ncbi:MAG TPA: hypothetical protein VFR93_11625 [Candidatus Limnocylindrales bacterium]|nr:hypothetical protein [Candidatus Limnocylindrales bacterium]
MTLDPNLAAALGPSAPFLALFVLASTGIVVAAAGIVALRLLAAPGSASRDSRRRLVAIVALGAATLALVAVPVFAVVVGGDPGARALLPSVLITAWLWVLTKTAGAIRQRGR